MSSVTQIQTETLQTPIQTSLVLRTSPSIYTQQQTAIERLQAIFEKYRHWDDRLSLRIFEWGAKVSQINFEDLSQSEKMDKVERKLEKLANKILVDSLAQLPLKDPVIDGGWVWDKSILEDYKKYFDRSLFTNEPINAVPHDFAKEIIEWLQFLEDNFPSTSHSSEAEQTNEQSLILSKINLNFTVLIKRSCLDSNQISLAINEDDSEECKSAKLKLNQLEYVNRIQNAKMLEGRYLAGKIIQQNREALQKLKEELQKNLEQKVKEAAAAAALHEKVINNNINSVQNSFQGAVNSLKSSIQDKNQQIHKIEQNLNYIKNISASQEQDIYYLQAQNGEMRRKIANLQDRNHSSCMIL